MNKQGGPASRKGQFLATLFATIGSFGLGTVLSWPAPTLPQLSTQSCPGSCEGLFILTIEQQSWVAALLNFGAFTAGPITGILMPWFGKKWTMVLLSLPIFSGWLFLVFAVNVEMLYLGRFLTGFSGAFSMLAPGFIAEICEVEIRGSLASFMQVMTMMGESKMRFLHYKTRLFSRSAVHLHHWYLPSLETDECSLLCSSYSCHCFLVLPTKITSLPSRERSKG